MKTNIPTDIWAKIWKKMQNVQPHNDRDAKKNKNTLVFFTRIESESLITNCDNEDTEKQSQIAVGVQPA